MDPADQVFLERKLHIVWIIVTDNSVEDVDGELVGDLPLRLKQLEEHPLHSGRKVDKDIMVQGPISL